MTAIGDLKTRYVDFFGIEPAEIGELDRIESALGVVLPVDFKQISAFYSGGLTGGISHHAIAAGGSANNVVDETIRIRSAVELPKRFIVLAEPAESIVLLNTNNDENINAVIWCDAVDIRNVGNSEFSTPPQVWRTYAEFFDYLLGEEGL